MPNDDLAQWKAIEDALVANVVPALDAVHVVVEDRPVRLQHSQHLPQALPLPLHVGPVRHIVAVAIVAGPVARTVPSAVLQVIGR